MPEYTELVSSCQLARNWFSAIKSSSTTSKLLLNNIMIDASVREQEAALAIIKKAQDNASTIAEVASRWPRLVPAAAKAATNAATIAAANFKMANGYPYNIEPGSDVSRGQSGAQGLVYPPLGSLPIAEANIELSNIEFNPRNVILEMNCCKTRTGRLFLQVQMLTHTVLQVYTEEQWHNSICKVSAKNRGFRIGMALDFGDWVIAFLSLDNMFKPAYALTRDKLPAQHIDIYSDFERFVDSAVNWAHCALFTQKRANTASLSNRPTGLPLKLAARDRLALHAIRNNRHIFGGIGVYTGSEIFFLAGLGGDLTEQEVFDNPSRFARFLEAFYEIAAAAHEEIWQAPEPLSFSGNILIRTRDFVKPFLNDNFFIAVENKHRLLYADRLYVHAKDRVFVPTRMRKLLDTYKNEVERRIKLSNHFWLRKPDGMIFDVFEPSFLRRSLSKSKNLGSMIFGKEKWRELGGTVWEDNPLDRYFSRRFRQANPMDRYVTLKPKKPIVVPATKTNAAENKNTIVAKKKTNLKIKTKPLVPPAPSTSYLQIQAYDSIFLSQNELKASWVTTYLYSTTDKKMWSILPLHSPNSLLEDPRRTTRFSTPVVQQITGDRREAELFHRIVTQTNKWAVGPLDYCGVARIIHGKVLLCMDDPNASSYAVHRLVRRRERRKHVKKGTSKEAYVGKAREGVQYKLGNAVSSSPSLTVEKEEEDGDLTEKKRKATVTADVEKPVKRRRFSADTKIALGMSLTVWGKSKARKL